MSETRAVCDLARAVERLSRKLDAYTHDWPDSEGPPGRDRFYISANVGQMLRWRVIDRKLGGLRYIAAFRDYDHAENYVAWCRENT